jgi:hypothetical protein
MQREGTFALLPVAAIFLVACSQEGTVVPQAAAEGGAGEDGGTVGAEAGGTASEAGGGDAGADGPVKPGASTLQSLVVSTGSLRPVFDPGVTDYDITSINGLYPLQVTATPTDPAAQLIIHGAPAQSGVPATVTLKPSENLDVTVEPTGGGAPSTYRVHYVPKDMPPWSVTSSAGAGTEPLLFSLLSTAVPTGNYVLMLDRSGAPLYYRTFPQQSVEDFQQMKLPNGDIRYTCTVGVLNPGGWTLGVDHVMDQKFNDVADYQLPAYASHGVLPAEAHDFLLLDSDHYIAMSYVMRTLDLSQVNPAWSTQAQVMSAVVQEVQNGNVLVEWDSANVPSLYTDSVDGNLYATPATATQLSDYLHLNSMDLAADGNILLSFRHTNSIVKVDRKTGKILWTLGGAEDMFGLTSTQFFSHQHHVRVHQDGSITVFDNGNKLHQTRVLRFVLDEVNHVVSSFQVLYTRPAAQPQTLFMGSAVPLSGGRYLFGWGGWFAPGGAPPPLAPAATEIDGTGNVVWSFEFTQPAFFSYRALPIAAP